MGAMNEYANNNNIDFTSIGNEILYAVGAGSTVEDKMGSAFNFVPGTLKLTVGGKELASASVGNVVYFGDRADTLNAQNYRFKVAYDPAADAFLWTINENVSNFAPVQLSYTVKLVDPKTAAGTYTEPTNEYAKLTPRDSAENQGKELPFPVPKVSYTVNGSGGGGDRDYDYTLTYVSNGGTKYPSESYSRYTTVKIKKVPSREGYSFTGWYSDKDLKNKITEVYMNGNKTIYAGWEMTKTPDQLNGDDHFAYVIGYTDGTVRPLGNITRSETAAIFFRLLKDNVRDGNLTASNSFKDVTADQWCNQAISTMAKLGIIKGRAANRFDPNAPITRAEFAAICARFDTGMTTGENNFTDISGHWAEAEIKRAASLGWIMGHTDGTFSPDDYITRAEAMTMINRVLNRLPEEDSDLLSGMNTWPDNKSGAWYYLAVQEATNTHDFELKKDGKHETWTKLTADPDWTRYEK